MESRTGSQSSTSTYDEARPEVVGAAPYAAGQSPYLQQSYHSQPGTPGPSLVQLGASQNYLINSRPAPYIQVLDIDPNYQRSRAPSPQSASCKYSSLPKNDSIFILTIFSFTAALCLLIHTSPEETIYRAIYLRDRTVGELIRCVIVKYGFNAQDFERVRTAIRIFRGIPLPLRDEDIAGLDNETEMVVAVKSIYIGSLEWQLEVTYG